MKLKKLTIIAGALILALGITACSTKTEDKKTESTTTESAKVVADKDKKEVIVPAEVNAKYFTEDTRHGVVFKGGSNGEKSILRGLADQTEFYNALISIGAKPGNNLTMKNMKASAKEGVSVEGSKLNVFVKWDGKEVPFKDVIKASDDRPMDIRFGGNLENAKEFKTGCILCLDSCAVGITSNAAYPTGTTQDKLVKFTGNKDVLPADGTKVDVIFRLAE